MKKILTLAVLGLLLFASCGLAGIPTAKLEQKKTDAADTSSKATAVVETRQEIGKEIFEGETNTPSGKGDTPITLWPIFWGLLSYDWRYYYLIGGQTSAEYGIELFVNYSFIGFGFHHIQLTVYWLAFGENVDYGWQISEFEEDRFIFLFLHKSYPIKISWADEAWVEIFLYVDGELYDIMSLDIG